MFGRLLALMKKEFLAIKNDKKSLVVVIIPPLIQVFLFSFAATLEVKHIEMAVMDKSGSEQSHALVREFKGSPHVKTVRYAKSYEEGTAMINTQKVLALVVIPDDFAKTLGTEHSELQLILDGRRSNTAQIVEGYLAQMILNYEKREGARVPVEVVARNFYNPNLDNFWWIVPNLFGSITMVVAMLLTSLSIARERELGTFDQIMVSPLRPFEILLGKLLPALLISLFESTIILFAAVNFFEVPLNGELWLLYLSVAVFLFSMSGIGLFVSAVAQTQQQAILGSFVILLPSFLLSGFATPVENIPYWLQPVTDFIPLKSYLLLIKGVFLKDISFADAVPELVPMFLLGVMFLSGTLLFFKKKVL